MENWILFPSVTYANKACYYFGRAGIHTRMERIPETMKSHTCGYRLLVKEDQLDKALEICQENRIRYTKIMQA